MILAEAEGGAAAASPFSKAAAVSTYTSHQAQDPNNATSDMTACFAGEV